MNASEFARQLSLSCLAPDGTRRDARAACDAAKQANLAAVYVLPTWVADAHEILQNSETQVASVVGFPHGNSSAATKAMEAATVVADGAEIVAMVVNVSAVKSGADLIVIDEMQSVADACAPGEAVFGVILESPLLTDDEKRRVAKIAAEMGADFIVTETGFSPNTDARKPDIGNEIRLLSANLEDVPLLANRASLTFREATQLLETGADGILTTNALTLLNSIPAD